jgi:hypothetical protein
MQEEIIMQTILLPSVVVVGVLSVVLSNKS